MYLVTLKPYHKKTRQVKHPLLVGCTAYTEEEIQDIAATKPDELVMAIRSCLRYLVARYSANWQACAPFLDDMVSEGFLAASRFVSDAELDKPKVMKRMTAWMQAAIEKFLNANQSLSAPSIRTQNYKISKGEMPTYLHSVSEFAEEMPEGDGDIYKRDVMEALNLIEARDYDEAFILCQENWGKSGQELANELGVHRTVVQKKRARLYQEYLKLTR